MDLSMSYDSYDYATAFLSMIFTPKTAIFGLIIGLLGCYLGFKLSKLCIGFCGFLTGIIIGVVLAIKNGNENYMVLGFFIAIIMAALAYNMYKLGSALVTFINTAISIFFMRLLTSSEGINLTSDDIKSAFILCCILGLIAGILTFIFTKPMFIISTSVSGGYISGLCLSILTEQTFILKIFPVIFIATGIFVQIKTNHGLFEKKARENIEEESAEL